MCLCLSVWLRAHRLCLVGRECRRKKGGVARSWPLLSGPVVPPMHYLFYFFTLGDTIVETQQRVVDTNHPGLPPPTSAQDDRETRGPPKVVKSEDQRLHRQLSTSFDCSSLSSAPYKLQLKSTFNRIPMDVVVSDQTLCRIVVVSLCPHFVPLSLSLSVLSSNEQN